MLMIKYRNKTGCLQFESQRPVYQVSRHVNLTNSSYSDDRKHYVLQYSTITYNR